MPQGCNGSIRIAVAATGAGMGSVTVLGAGGFGDYIGVIMPQGCYHIIDIALFAALAGIGGIAILGASRCGDHCVIVVAQGFGGFRISIAAGCANIGGYAAVGAGSLADRCLVVMAGCGNRLGIAVAAAGAGVGLAAILGAGSRNNRLLVIMAQLRHGVTSIAVAANLAGIGGVARLGASGCRYHGSIAVTGCRNGFGIAVTAVDAGIGDGAVRGAGGRRFSSLLIVMDMIRLNGHHILGAVHHIGSGASGHTGEGKLGAGLRAGLNGAGGGCTGEGCAVIAAPCNLRQLPPVVPRRGDDHLDIPEALNRFGDLIGLRHSSASAAGIGANGSPVLPVGGNLNVCIGAVVSMGRRRNLNGVKPYLSPQVYPGIHANGLTVAGPVIGGGVAVDEVGSHAVIAANGIAGNGGRNGSGIGNRSAGSLDVVEVCLGDGRITGIGNGLLALQGIDFGGLPHLQGNILSGQQLRVGIAAAGAGIDGVALVVGSSIVMAQSGHGFGIAVAAVGAGIGNAAGLGASGCLGGSGLIVMYLCRRIGVQGTVCIKAAGYHGLIEAAGIAAVHGKAHCPEGQADLLRLLCLRLCAGIIAPHAEHAADHRGRIDGCAAHLIVAPVGSIGIAAVKVIALAQHIVEVAGGIDDLEPVAGKIGCGAEAIATPAAGPIAHHDVLIKGVGGRASRCAGLVAVFDAVVKGNGGHARLLYHGGKLVDVLNEVAVLIGALEIAKAHAAGGIAVVGILVSAKVEVFAALACEVINILLDKRLGKSHRRAVRHVDGTNRAVIAASDSRQGSRRIQHRVHMSGAVEQGDDLNSGCIGSGKDLVHFAFAPLAGGVCGVTGIARLDCRFHCIAGIGFGIDGQRHVIQ